MKRSQQKLQGKTLWLEMLKSDTELVETSGVSLDGIRARATEVLAQLAARNISDAQATKGKKAALESRKSQNLNGDRKLSSSLFEAYRNSEDILTRCAICYLSKNGGKLSDKEENSEKLTQRRRKVEIQSERLEEQLAARIPLMSRFE